MRPSWLKTTSSHLPVLLAEVNTVGEILHRLNHTFSETQEHSDPC